MFSCKPNLLRVNPTESLYNPRAIQLAGYRVDDGDLGGVTSDAHGLEAVR
jgi:hypothetical protein